MTAKNGPYLVTNVTTLRTPLGEQRPVPPTLALCRCGASATKPSCDGACATSGFTGGKDPKRVPDQRDAYPGTQVTIFDNRGICQHSGLCTDRAPTAFRTGTEPFVAPSGASPRRARPGRARLPVGRAEPGLRPRRRRAAWPTGTAPGSARSR